MVAARPRQVTGTGGWQSAGTWRSPAPPSTRRGRPARCRPSSSCAPDLWSIPVPIPHNPLRYVSVYAFALDGGGLGPARHRLGERRGLGGADRRAGLDRRRDRRRPRRPRHPPALRPPRAWPPGCGEASRRLGRDAPGRRRRSCRRPDHRRRRPRWSPPRSTSSSGWAPTATRRSPTSGPAERLERVHAHGRPRPAARGRRARRLPRLADARRPHARATRPATCASPRRDTRLFFSGDHVLPRISPNISTSHDGLADPLRDYLDSLAAVRRPGPGRGAAGARVALPRAGRPRRTR